MSFAVRDDLMGCRAISDKSEIGPGEHYRESIADLVPPVRREDVEAARLKAYADPITGSDRYFSEAMRLEALGASGADDARGKGNARHQEIQDANPWPK